MPIACRGRQALGWGPAPWAARPALPAWRSLGTAKRSGPAAAGLSKPRKVLRLPPAPPYSASRRRVRRGPRANWRGGALAAAATPENRKGSMGSDVRGGRGQEGGRPEFESHPSQARSLLLCSSGEIERTQPDVGWERDGHSQASGRGADRSGRGWGGEADTLLRNLGHCHSEEARTPTLTAAAAPVEMDLEVSNPPYPSSSLCQFRADPAFHRTQR